MKLADIFRVINEMHKKGVLKDYAIGGAVATIYYTEPFATRDVEIFFIPLEKERLILLTPFYDFLLKKGYKTYKEYILIADTPVQFIPSSDRLEREAVENAMPAKYKKIEINIIRAEYLIAIFLKVYRPKDREKLIRLLDQAKIDRDYLSGILRRHNLTRKFNEFKRKHGEI